ncbi:glycine zipper family protein [Castellaniella sp. UC4442_H9]|jgi:hypothetical protein
MKRVILAVLCAAIAGCASYRPVVDTQGVDPAQYEKDLKECQAYAKQVNPGAQAGVGMALGAVLGALLGAAVGGNNAGYYAGVGAASGAVTGGAYGAAGGAGDQKTIIVRCLMYRGYRVLG